MVIPQATPEPAREHVVPWYRQGIIWLCAAVTLLSVAGSVWLILVARAHEDPPLEISGPRIMKVPVMRAPAAVAGESGPDQPL